MAKKHSPVHPGAFLSELLAEINITQAQLARGIGISSMRVSYVIKGARPVTADIALRLGRYFGQSAQYWLNLQARYDLDCALDAIGKDVLSAIHPIAA